ncbi:coiled-coil domain-containing protein 92-like [Gigantopelta aegis]|uniref:coiled-coil domain-containing protein 92-like n=1 Tax=Gigantopelta aegis TaxID=1735272 RepID=UPI001B88BE69|nr:coiled-coil domain-containing protein 92-like [Gigantopelta aegis]XP_041348956.1 coiled-coil domain-containing protein 92-like [Gigantopelta aegis]XP_041348957.1 coiled-coil domain-containing protein 92-like [Gigantopelta aegis]
MMNQTATYQRNLESSILFIQQEHANTLKALHEEIHSLQKKCSDLQFQLHVTEQPSVETDVQDNTFDLETSIKECKELESQLREEIVQKNKKVQILEHELRLQKKRYLDEQRAHMQQINSLRADLDVKSNSVAYLTTELHRIKIKQKVDLDSTVDSSIRRTQAVRIPAPPKDIPPRVRRSYVRRSVGLPLHTEDLENRPLRILSSKSSGSSRSESPDVAPFITRTEMPTTVKTQPVLPPIPVQHGGKPVIVHNVVRSANCVARRKAESSSPEVATLAVEQVSHTDASWGHAQESRSSEYN